MNIISSKLILINIWKKKNSRYEGAHSSTPLCWEDMKQQHQHCALGWRARLTSTLFQDVRGKLAEGDSSNWQVWTVLQHVEVLGHQCCTVHQTHGSLCMLCSLTVLLGHVCQPGEPQVRRVLIASCCGGGCRLGWMCSVAEGVTDNGNTVVAVDGCGDFRNNQSLLFVYFCLFFLCVLYLTGVLFPLATFTSIMWSLFPIKHLYSISFTKSVSFPYTKYYCKGSPSLYIVFSVTQSPMCMYVYRTLKILPSTVDFSAVSFCSSLISAHHLQLL